MKFISFAIFVIFGVLFSAKVTGLFDVGWPVINIFGFYIIGFYIGIKYRDFLRK